MTTEFVIGTLVINFFKGLLLGAAIWAMCSLVYTGFYFFRNMFRRRR